ncbi:hypothetical protein PanWU01x14_188920 [Parasponia andersonii]|uniref:Transmembrane protein n=1 Tax=Parasponia andersonii TaxID=3476 RepID=A0A2P5C2V8_PARAD|nr:hypothetical protein PanWU01x14_188920 [Parasponia andersonii]
MVIVVEGLLLEEINILQQNHSWLHIINSWPMLLLVLYMITSIRIFSSSLLKKKKKKKKKARHDSFSCCHLLLDVITAPPPPPPPPFCLFFARDPREQPRKQKLQCCSYLFSDFQCCFGCSTPPNNHRSTSSSP